MRTSEALALSAPRLTTLKDTSPTVSFALFSLTIGRAPSSTLFPYTTLFRSRLAGRGQPASTRFLLLRKSDRPRRRAGPDRKSTRLNSSHTVISYAVFCLKKKNMSRAVVNLKQLVQHHHPSIVSTSNKRLQI